MIPLYTQIDFNTAKSIDKLPCECEHCHKTFFKLKKEINCFLNGNKNRSIKFCSKQCLSLSNKGRFELLICLTCGSEFKKLNSQIKKSINHFCSKSCSATHHNKNKKHGTNRSKLELYLEEQLTLLYPNLQIDYNKIDSINSELDIYIPLYKLAFELNGIFHYEPIFGLDKLNKTQKTDSNKFQRCQEQKISLCVIDTSSQKYFKESTSKKYLDIIVNIINQRTSLLTS